MSVYIKTPMEEYPNRCEECSYVKYFPPFEFASTKYVGCKLSPEIEVSGSRAIRPAACPIDESVIQVVRCRDCGAWIECDERCGDDGYCSEGYIVEQKKGSNDV